MENLNKLFEEAKKEGGVEAGFKRLAEYLMNECVLEVNSEKYQLAEIEFYYYDKENHPDVFVHCDEEQLNSNTFYVHNKGGIRAGIDITFGNKNYYGGILIRSLKNINNDEEPIKGSKNCRELMEKKLRINSLKDLKKLLTGKNIDEYIKNKTSINKNFLLKSCRVGLNFSNQCHNFDLEKEFIFKPYRYILKDETVILSLLDYTDSHFLAYFLEKNNNFTNKKIQSKIDYIKKDTFLKSDTKRREFFIENFVEN